MKKRLISFLLIISVFLISMAGNLTSAGADDNFPVHSPEQTLLKFKPGTPDTIKAEIQSRYSIKTLDIIEGIDVLVINLPADNFMENMRNLRFENSIEFIEPDFIATADVMTNDIFYPYQWGLNKIKAPQAWDITKGSANVGIAICDTGISQNHPDLAEKIKAGRNYTASDTLDDRNGHGTHMAGIAAAISNNKTGIAGTGYYSCLMNAKVLGDNGIGYYSWMAKGIIWAANNGARVINISSGGNFPSITLENAVNYAWSRNCIIVASAGNANAGRPHFPAAYTNCIAVAATDKFDNKASFSNYGPWVDMASPGVDIYSTVPNRSNNTPYLNYGCLSGTSTAAPFTSGIAALVWTTKYGTNCIDVMSQIINSGEQAGSIWSNYGIKRLNAYNAVK